MMVMRSLWSRTGRRVWASAGTASEARATAAAETASTDARRIEMVLVFYQPPGRQAVPFRFHTIASFLRPGSHSFATTLGQIATLLQRFAVKRRGCGPRLLANEARIVTSASQVSLNCRSPSF